MKQNPEMACACQTPPAATAADGLMRYVLLGLPLLAAWWLIYGQLERFSNWLTHGVLGLDLAGHLGAAVQFFLYDTPKVFMLLTLVVFGVGVVRSFFSPERTRALLAGRREAAGNVMAAGLGVFTPFCSCSAVPLFIGFVTAGVPLGVTFSFLIAAPMVNEVALVLLYGLFGWRVAALYLGFGLLVAMAAGWVIGRLGLEGWMEDWVRQMRAAPADVPEERPSPADRVRYGIEAVREIVGKVWLYVVAGLAVGAFIHGYVPEDFLAGMMGRHAWWAVPLSVLLGVPMYANAAGIVPVVQALMEKGAALGTVLAFMMSVIALSLPEMLILRKVLKPRLIAVFAGVVGAGILVVGYLFNLLV
ncbi:MAG: permease [Pseudomonadota bacterium]